jgi:hypothetical protein
MPTRPSPARNLIALAVVAVICLVAIYLIADVDSVSQVVRMVLSS